MGLQIGLRLHDGEKLPIAELLPLVREKGFTCAHLALTKSVGEYPSDSAALTPGYAMYLRRLFAENRLDVAVLGCYLALSSRNCPVAVYKAHLRFAKHLGAGMVGSETNGEDMPTLVENLKRITSYAEAYGVMLAVEPVATHIMSTPELTREVLDRVNSPNLGVIFDPVNLLSGENLHRRDDILASAMELLADDILAVHIKDYQVRDEGLVSVGAGQGEMEYTRILQFIKTRKPFIHVTLENTQPATAEASRRHVQMIYDSL